MCKERSKSARECLQTGWTTYRPDLLLNHSKKIPTLQGPRMREKNGNLWFSIFFKNTVLKTTDI